MVTVTSRGQILFYPLNEKLILQVPLSKPTRQESFVPFLNSKWCQQLEAHMNFRNVHFLKDVLVFETDGSLH